MHAAFELFFSRPGREAWPAFAFSRELWSLSFGNACMEMEPARCGDPCEDLSPSVFADLGLISFGHDMHVAWSSDSDAWCACLCLPVWLATERDEHAYRIVCMRAAAACIGHQVVRVSGRSVWKLLLLPSA